jgi:hypothetical protein
VQCAPSGAVVVLQQVCAMAVPAVSGWLLVCPHRFLAFMEGLLPLTNPWSARLLMGTGTS